MEPGDRRPRLIGSRNDHVDFRVREEERFRREGRQLSREPLGAETKSRRREMMDCLSAHASDSSLSWLYVVGPLEYIVFVEIYRAAGQYWLVITQYCSTEGGFNWLLPAHLGICRLVAEPRCDISIALRQLRHFT